MSVFLVTGIGRSGTSALGRLLNLCPGILCTHEKGADIQKHCTDKKDRNRLVFPDRLPFAIKEVGFAQYSEKRNEEIYRFGAKIPYPDAFHDLFLHYPELTVIAIVRHPVDTMLSQWSCEQGDTNPGWPKHISGFNGGRYKVTMHHNFMNFIENIRNVHVFKFEQLFMDYEKVRDLFADLDTFVTVDKAIEYLGVSASTKNPPSRNTDPEYGDIDNPLRSIYSEKYEEYRKMIAEDCPYFLQTFNYKV